MKDLTRHLGTQRDLRRSVQRIARAGVLATGIAATGGGIWFCAQSLLAQEARTPVFRSKVDLVVLSFTVTDSKGKYVNGLKPTDFRILEDGIKEKISTFSEGNRPAMEIADDGSLKPLQPREVPEGERTINLGVG